MGNKPLISVVVPVYNEEEHLIDFLNQQYEAISKLKLSFELIISENGSTDRSLSMAKDFAKRHKYVSVLHSPNPNYGLAVKKGFVKARGVHLVLFDLDYWDTAFVSKALKLNQCDAVVATKNSAKAKDQRSGFRRLISRGFTQLLKILFSLEISDTHGVKILKSSSFKPLIKNCLMTKEIFDTELLIRGQSTGLRLKEIPVVVKERRATRSSILRRSVLTLKDLGVLKYCLLRESFNLKSTVQALAPILGILLLGMMMLSPSLKLPFSLIDDPVSIEYAEQIKSSLSQGNIGQLGFLLREENGRIRPLYWLGFYLQYLLFGLNSVWYHWARVLMVLSTLLLIYWLAKRISASGFVAFLTSVFSLIFFRTFENYIRLGPQEVPLLFFIFLGLTLVIYFPKSRLLTNLASLSVLIGMFSKETAIFVVPLLLTAVVFDKARRESWKKLFLTSIFGASAILAIRFLGNPSQGYAGNYIISPFLWLETAKQYKQVLDTTWTTRLLQLSILTYFISLFTGRKQGPFIIGGLWIFFSLAILLPWQMAFGRYLSPVIPGIAFVIAYATKQMIDISYRSKIYLLFLLVFGYYWANFIFTNTVQSLNISADHLVREQTNVALVEAVAESASRGGTLSFNFEDDPNYYEWIDNVGRQLAYIYGRPDIKTQLVTNLETSDLIADWSLGPRRFQLEEINANCCESILKIEEKSTQYSPLLKLSLVNLTTKGSLLLQQSPSTFTWHLYRSSK
jgi:glycosyltransferase involved in cell wall biosynthesis